MIAYLDSSALLRVILGQPRKLAEWKAIELGIASVIIEVECLRALDRLRLANKLSGQELVSRREMIYRALEDMTLVEVSTAILRRASDPLPLPLGTLNAIHLATALVWIDDNGGALTMATHDEALGAAARASGLRVIGLAA